MAIPNTPDTKARSKDANLDPITKAPGAHPVGTGVGAAAGGIAGAATAGAMAGTAVGGPVGAAVGLAAGAIIGGLAGKALAEKIDPTVEDAYWREAHRKEPYYSREMNYDDYAPAYRVGYSGYATRAGQTFEQAESDLESEYAEQRGKSRLGWDRARPAANAAWTRAEKTYGTDTSTRN